MATIPLAAPVLPKSLQFMASRLSGYSRRKVRIVSTSSTTASGGSILQIKLPQEVVDLSTLSLWGKLTTTAATSGSNVAVYDTNMLVENYQLTVGGQSINSTFDYPGIWFALNQYQMGDKANSRLLVSNMLTLDANTSKHVAPTTNLASREICIDQWLGVLGTLSPQIMDLSLMPEVILTIRFAQAEDVLVANNATAGAVSYSLSDISMEVDVLGLPQIYYQTIQSYLSGGGVLECPFTNIVSYQGASQPVGGAIQSFQLAAQSIDAVVSTVVDTSKLAKDQAARAWSSDVYNSKRFERGVSGLTDIEVKVNAVSYPIYGKVSYTRSAHSVIHNLMGGSKDALGSCSKSLESITAFRDSHYCHVTRFNHINDAGDYENRLISGLNTQGNPAVFTIQYSGSTTPITPISWVFCTASLLISQFKSVEVRL